MTYTKVGYNYETLEVWQRSMGLVKTIYQLIKSFPKVEQYGLSDQLRRAANKKPRPMDKVL